MSQTVTVGVMIDPVNYWKSRGSLPYLYYKVTHCGVAVEIICGDVRDLSMTLFYHLRDLDDLVQLDIISSNQLLE